MIQASHLVQWGFVSLAVAYEGRICKDCNGGIFVALTSVYMLWQGRDKQGSLGREGREASGVERMMIEARVLFESWPLACQWLPGRWPSRPAMQACVASGDLCGGGVGFDLVR